MRHTDEQNTDGIKTAHRNLLLRSDMFALVEWNQQQALLPLSSHSLEAPTNFSPSASFLFHHLLEWEADLSSLLTLHARDLQPVGTPLCCREVTLRSRE